MLLQGGFNLLGGGNKIIWEENKKGYWREESLDVGRNREKTDTGKTIIEGGSQTKEIKKKKGGGR